MIKRGLAVRGLQCDALRVAFNAQHWRVQSGIVNACDHFFYVMLCPAVHGVPLRPVVDLNQPVVVAKPDHGGHRKQQHLIGWATPNAAQHGQQIPIAEFIAKAMLRQEVPQRLGQLLIFIALGHLRCQGVKAQHLAQHLDKAWLEQIAALGKNRVERGAIPLQRAFAIGLRHLNRKRHV